MVTLHKWHNTNIMRILDRLPEGGLLTGNGPVGCPHAQPVEEDEQLELPGPPAGTGPGEDGADAAEGGAADPEVALEGQPLVVQVVQQQVAHARAAVHRLTHRGHRLGLRGRAEVALGHARAGQGALKGYSGVFGFF